MEVVVNYYEKGKDIQKIVEKKFTSITDAVDFINSLPDSVNAWVSQEGLKIEKSVEP